MRSAMNTANFLNTMKQSLEGGSQILMARVSEDSLWTACMTILSLFL